MVQQTLDATKSFIFDVRPMVLDDLGLVPTIRRAARDAAGGRRSRSSSSRIGADRRLSMELESGLFRILDETLAAYLAGRPDRVDDPPRLGRRPRGADRRAPPASRHPTPGRHRAAAAADAAQAEHTRPSGRGKAAAPQEAIRPPWPR